MFFGENMSYRKLISASVIVTGLGFLSNIVSFIKELIVANYFGIGDALDIFAMGLALPFFFSGLLGSAIGTAVVPGYVIAKNEKNDSEFITEVTWLLSFILIFVVLLCCLSVFCALPFMMGEFSDSKQSLSLSVALFLSPMIFVHGISSFIDSIYNVNERFLINALASITIPLGTIIVLFCGFSVNVWTLCYGLYFGYFLKIGIQLLLLFRSKLLLPKLYIANVFKKYESLISDSLYIILSSIILAVLPLIGQSYAASLEVGAVSTLNYANKLSGIGLMIAVGVINAIIFPFLAKKTISHGMIISAKIGSRLALGLLFFSFLCAIPLFYILEPIIRVLFERGAFNREHTIQVANLLQFYLLYIPFYISGIVLARVVVSIGKSKFFIMGNVISVVVFYISCEFFVKKMGVSGIAVSLMMVYFFSFLYLYFIIHYVEVKGNAT